MDNVDENMTNSVELNEKQKEALRELWFIYGNSAPNSTKGNHGYIQGLLQYNEDRKEFYLRGEKNMRESGFPEDFIKKKMLTKECIRVVEKTIRDNE